MAFKSFSRVALLKVEGHWRRSRWDTSADNTFTQLPTVIKPYRRTAYVFSFVKWRDGMSPCAPSLNVPVSSQAIRPYVLIQSGFVDREKYQAIFQMYRGFLVLTWHFEGFVDESQVPPQFASHMILSAVREGALNLSANPCKQMPAYDGGRGARLGREQIIRNPSDAMRGFVSVNNRLALSPFRMSCLPACCLLGRDR